MSDELLECPRCGRIAPDEAWGEAPLGSPDPGLRCQDCWHDGYAAIPTATRRRSAREAVRKARRIVAMLQGTMGLEGQRLDRATLRAMKRQTIREILGSGR